MNNETEISFGAFDNEFLHQEIFIPEGFEATIECDKIILTRKESEDENIKVCIGMCLTDVYEQRFKDFNVRLKDCLDWVVKQGEKPQRMISAEAKEDLYNKSAWSEKDEEMLKSVMATCELAEQERDSSPAKHLLEMQLNWLKSIKQKIENKL